jgi:alkanesulfonate monooxygenase SsuD/methylene tetrahydromethanopterin reductase-like flavin-dependent oxidoreductase (luciferase family)
VQFGIAPATRVADGAARRLDLAGFVTECRAAERAGFVSAYTGERHVGDRRSQSSPLLVMAVALAQTTTIRLGSALVVLPLHHPVTVAEETALLGAAFPNRVRLGVGAGYLPGDFAPFGVGLGERLARMRAGLQAIAAFRRGVTGPLDGPWPGEVPERDPALGEDTTEVFVGAWSEPGIRLAAEYGDAWLTDPIRCGSWIMHLAERYRAECARLGRTPRIVLFREAWLDESPAAAAATVGASLLANYRPYLGLGNAFHPRWDPWLPDVSGPGDLLLRHIVPDRILLGGAADWRAQLDAWQATLAPDEVIVRLRHVTGPSAERTVAAIDAVGTQIIPHYDASRGARQ